MADLRAARLQVNSILLTLDLGHSGIGATGVDALAEALRVNVSRRRAPLHLDVIEDGRITVTQHPTVLVPK